jgi:hypothetical protein
LNIYKRQELKLYNANVTGLAPGKDEQ